MRTAKRLLVLLTAGVAMAQAGNPARRVISAASLPATCVSSVIVKDVYWQNSNRQLYVCTATNTWTASGAVPPLSLSGPTLTTTLLTLQSTDDNTANRVLQLRSSTGADLGGFNADGTLNLNAGGLLLGTVLTLDSTSVRFFTSGTGNTNTLDYVDAQGPRWADASRGHALTHSLQLLTADRTATWPDANTAIPVIPQVITISGPTAARTITVPDASFTAARTDAANTFTGTQTFSGQIASSIATGTAPLTVASTTQVTNLNASQLVGATWVAPGTIGSTTPATGAFTSLAAGSAKWNVNTSGLPTQSNNLTLAGQGYPLLLGVTSQKAETTTADANVLTVTPAAAVGTYRACVAISVASATSGVISWTLSWTDSNGNAQANIAQQLFQMATAAPNTTFTTSAAGNYYGCSMIDVNTAAASIIVKWVGGGTTSAKVSATVERLN